MPMNSFASVRDKTPKDRIVKPVIIFHELMRHWSKIRTPKLTCLTSLLFRKRIIISQKLTLLKGNFWFYIPGFHRNAKHKGMFQFTWGFFEKLGQKSTWQYDLCKTHPFSFERIGSKIIRQNNLTNHWRIYFFKCFDTWRV